MGKVLWTEDGEQLGKNHSGCMSGIFHALDYQLRRSNVKKIFPHRKHHTTGQHAKRNRRYNRISDDKDASEVPKHLDQKASHFMVGQSYRKTNSTQKRTIKSRIKALISEGDTFKDDNDKEHELNDVSTPRLQMTNSVHHLETNEWVHPIIFFSEDVTRSPVRSNRHGDITSPKIKDSQDILEMLEVDKEIFVNIIHNGSRVPDYKAKLTKSGSFPSAYKLGSRNLRPTKLKDKLNEFYAVPKTDNRLDTLAPKLASSDYQKVMHFRRVSSLNESADRYSRLFDFTVSKEASLLSSRSLKFTNGSENLLHTQEPSFFRRNHSLPHLDNPYQESHDAYLLGSASQNERRPVSFPLQTDKKAELCTTENHECLNEEMEKTDTFLENELSITDNVNANSPEIGEDKCEFIIGEEICHGSQVRISEDFDWLSSSQDNLEKETKNVNYNKHMDSSTKSYQDEDDFFYVKQILERSGFIKNGFQQVWYSSNQPLDPMVFQEIESQYFHDPEHLADDFNEISHRLLIFELVDDILVSMYERSMTYYPKALSSSCHIHPALTAVLILDEVLKHVSRLLNLKPDMEQFLDYIVDRDLGSDDGWMNLQLDSECVAFDLEDLILDQVLEEVVFEYR